MTGGKLFQMLDPATKPNKLVLFLFSYLSPFRCYVHQPKDSVDSSVIFVKKIKTRTRIIGRRFQRTRTRIIVIQKTKTK